MNKKTYTGSKIQNHFTAYLIQFVRGKRHDYLEKKIQILWEFFVIFVALFGSGTYRNRKETYPKMYTF